MISYYELYGLPGAGKTTICDPLIEQLRKEGYRVASWDEVFYRNCTISSKRRVFLEMLCSFDEFSIFFRYWLIYRKCKSGHKYYLKKLLFLIHQILKTIEEENYDIVIIDEGIIQFTSSLCFMENFPDNVNIEKIAYKFKKKFAIHPILCSVSMEECMKRIKERPYGQERRYSYKKGQSFLKEALKHRENNLNVISSVFANPIVIDMTKDSKENVKSLSYIINKQNNK